MTTVNAYAKINLALVVGERRADRLHDVATVLQRVELADRIAVEPADELVVDGFAADTIVREALERLAAEAETAARWRVSIGKEIPVAAGLGGGSADAAAALEAANASLAVPLPADRLAAVAALVGADVPFFLEPGPKLAEGAGERLTPLDLPLDYWVAIALPRGRRKTSTEDVYRRFDELPPAGHGFSERRAQLLEALRGCRSASDLARLPANDLAEAAGRPASLTTLASSGAFRADVSGAGPAVYGLFEERSAAAAAVERLAGDAAAWVVRPVW